MTHLFAFDPSLTGEIVALFFHIQVIMQKIRVINRLKNRIRKVRKL